MQPGDYVRHKYDSEIEGKVVRPPDGKNQWVSGVIPDGVFTHTVMISIMLAGTGEVRTFDVNMIERVA